MCMDVDGVRVKFQLDFHERTSTRKRVMRFVIHAYVRFYHSFSIHLDNDMIAWPFSPCPQSSGLTGNVVFVRGFHDIATGDFWLRTTQNERYDANFFY